MKDREKLIALLREARERYIYTEEQAQFLINNEVAPVAHGEWVGTADGYADGELVYDMWSCSECGYDADGAEEKPDWNYCPNCGVKMDGGKNG